MADFDANLIASPDISEGASGGGTISAQLRAVPAVMAATSGGGTIPARFMLFGNVAKSVNRVYDSVAAKFVTWPSGSPDPEGEQYPGPGMFGVNTSGYVLLSSD